MWSCKYLIQKSLLKLLLQVFIYLFFFVTFHFCHSPSVACWLTLMLGSSFVICSVLECTKYIYMHATEFDLFV